MEYWNKIDLHQHTLHELTYDGKCPYTNYSHKEFEELIIKQGVKLKAVTNHNTLNISDHVKHALICRKNNVQYLPGVEIDYLFDKRDVHAITIINPQCDIIPFSSNLDNYINNKEKNKFLDKKEFAEVHENLEYIFIPHIMKGKGVYPASTKPPVEKAEDWVMSMIRNGIFVPVIFENTQDYYKYTVYTKIEQYFRGNYETPPCYVGSDYKFDNDVNRKKTAIERVKYYINAEPTYRGLEISIRNHEKRLAHENDLINRNNYLTEARIIPSDNFHESTLHFSPYLNVIIGASGAGKTLLLNEIYRKIKKEDLSDVQIGNSNSKKKTSAYFNKTGGKEILEIVSKPEDFSKLKVIEIPNIYTEIMKYVNDSTKLSEVFGISNRSYINTIIGNYLNNCTEYEDLLALKNESKQNGEEEFNNIVSSIEFMRINKSEKSNFSLNIKTQIKKVSSDIQNNITGNNELLDKSDEIINYFRKMEVAIGDDSTKLVNGIIEAYEVLLKMLMNKNIALEKEKIKSLINEKIVLLLNNAIKETNTKLGQKDQAIKTREEVLSINNEKISKSIRDYIKAESKANDICLAYPLEKIKTTIEKNNATQLARFTMLLTEKELSQINIVDGDNSLINTNNKSTKLKKIKQQTVNFLDSTQVKKFIEEINQHGVFIKDTLYTDVPLKLELFTEEKEWKSATSINQGTIAKISMKYYFEDLIKNAQPDIVFIDQPENDVDKEFLTNTLASFLLNQKMTTQIFITSHDPILTVNADANMIIQADVDENNKILYHSYPLEYTDNSMIGTDRVAKLLDGGKNNIKKRYQIYGGILKYGN